MGLTARPQRTVTPVQRSNGVSPTPNPRGVEGRDLLLCPPVLGLRAEYLPPLDVFSLVGGVLLGANSAPGGASRRPCRVLQHDEELHARLAGSGSLIITLRLFSYLI